MPTRKFTDYAKSGLIPAIYIGGVTPDDKVLTYGDVFDTVGNVISNGNIVFKDGDYYNTYNDFGAKQFYNGVQDNILYAGADRFGLTFSGFSTYDASTLFNGSETYTTKVAVDTTATLTIDVTTNDEYSANGIIYASGFFYVDFYSTYYPESISMRVKNRDDVWTAVTEIVDIATSATYRVFRATVPISVYMKVIELTINAQVAVETWISSIYYIPFRGRPFNSGVVLKDFENSLHHDLTIRNGSTLTFKNPSNVSNAMVFSGANAIATTPDIQFGSNGLIAFENSCYINIDSTNTGTTNIFQIGKDTATSAATTIFKIGEAGQVYIPYTSDGGLANDGALTLGAASGLNITLDSNEILARNNGSASILSLNYDGGEVRANNKRVVTTKDFYSASTTINYYRKIMRVTITSQFGSFTGQYACIGSGNIDGYGKSATVSMNIKQQSSFGANPIIDCYVHPHTLGTGNQILGNTWFYYKIVQNTPTTIVDIYVRMILLYTSTMGTGTMYHNVSSTVTHYTASTAVSAVSGGVVFQAV